MHIESCRKDDTHNRVYTSIIYLFIRILSFKRVGLGGPPVSTQLPSLPSHPKFLQISPSEVTGEDDAKKHQRYNYVKMTYSKEQCDVSPKVKTSYQCISPTFTRAIIKQ